MKKTVSLLIALICTGQCIPAQQAMRSSAVQQQNQIPSQEELKVFFSAAYNSNYPKVFELIQKYGKNIVNQQTTLNYPVILIAVEPEWSNEEFEKLLQIPGIDKNRFEMVGVFNPLITAIKQNQTKKLELLLKYKANPDIQSIEGYTPLMVAAQEKKADVVRMLLQAGASTEGAVNQGTYRGKTFLDFAAEDPAVWKTYQEHKHEANKWVAENPDATSVLRDIIDVATASMPTQQPEAKKQTWLEWAKSFLPGHKKSDEHWNWDTIDTNDVAFPKDFTFGSAICTFQTDAKHSITEKRVENKD